ncbi:6-phospho-3-hexuloisomerase [Paenibacillus humicola]|uniref:6-phospho-3-hexuloisomerase n=1 Tax=Paenibacillus humicola TaxID=3110540 RepID=UPI00237BDA1B|nr:6-phospho-3-hexuloisomerase [Paenibacillus humicola]
MTEFSSHAAGILDELKRVLLAVSGEEAERLAASIGAAEAVFVAGAGRSGLMMRAFAMRLMHMGVCVHIAGDTVAPALKPSGLLLIGSGSGETKSLAAMAAKAKQLGAGVALVTTMPDSAIGRLADTVVRIPAVAKDAADRAEISIQPMGSLFEQALLLLLDGVVLRLMELKGVAAPDMAARHANLE